MNLLVMHQMYFITINFTFDVEILKIMELIRNS